MEFHKFLNFLSFFNFYRISYLSFSFSHLMFLIFGSYRTIGFLESTCRFINAPSLVSPDLSFNEISILVFCCAFRGDMSLEVIQECSRIYGLSGVLGIFANNSRVTPLDTNHLSNLLLLSFSFLFLSLFSSSFSYKWSG